MEVSDLFSVSFVRSLTSNDRVSLVRGHASPQYWLDKRAEHTVQYKRISCAVDASNLAPLGSNISVYKLGRHGDRMHWELQRIQRAVLPLTVFCQYVKWPLNKWSMLSKLAIMAGILVEKLLNTMRSA